MNRFLTRWSSNWIDPTIFVFKKSPSPRVISNITYSALSCTHNITTRNVMTSSRLQVSFVYTITLKTGNLLGAGTDAKVYIRMIGDRGSTDEVMLKTKKTDLERGTMNYYDFPSDDVGPLKKIIIRHDNTGFAPGWYLDWVSILDGKGKKYKFKCDQWLTKGETYGNIVLLKEDGYVQDPNPIESIRNEEEESTNNDDEMLRDVLKATNNKSQIHAISPLTRHSKSLSPAVRNLLDTYGIDMYKVSSSGRDSRILKGDVLQYMLKENITQKKFVVSMLHPVKEKAPVVDDIVSEVIQTESTIKEKTEANYTDYAIKGTKQMLDHELKINKFEVPHLYMSTSCPVEELDTFVKELYKESKSPTETTKVILVRILSQSLLDAIIINKNEDIDILVTHNGTSTVIKNCADADIDYIFKQCCNSNEIVDTFTLPRYGLNIVDTEGVSQLSSILRFGQVISLNIGGTKLDIDTNGNMTKSMSLAISCDSRIVSEVSCALLLLNCKHYLSNPNLLGL